MKLVWKAVVYVFLMNAVLFVGACLVGVRYGFNYIFNLVIPVICAFTAWKVEQNKAKKAGMKNSGE